MKKNYNQIKPPINQKKSKKNDVKEETPQADDTHKPKKYEKNEMKELLKKIEDIDERMSKIENTKDVYSEAKFKEVCRIKFDDYSYPTPSVKNEILNELFPGTDVKDRKKMNETIVKRFNKMRQSFKQEVLKRASLTQKFDDLESAIPYILGNAGFSCSQEAKNRARRILTKS